MDLENGTVLVTGATGSVGPYIIEALRTRGANVVGTYHSAPPDDGVAGVSYHQVDLTDAASTTALAETVADRHGSVDHVVALAGGFSMGGIERTDVGSFRNALDLHATTAFLTVQAFVDDLDEESAVVLFSSERAMTGTAGSIAYNVGKGAVRTLAESLDAELDARVNALAPFIIDVAANRRAMPDADVSNWTAPESIAEAVVLLLENAGVTGHVLRMRGGQLDV